MQGSVLFRRRSYQTTRWSSEGTCIGEIISIHHLLLKHIRQCPAAIGQHLPPTMDLVYAVHILYDFSNCVNIELLWGLFSSV